MTLIFLNGRRPPKLIKQCNLKEMKAEFYTILKNSTAKLLPGNLTNITTKNIWHNYFFKSTLIGCYIIVNQVTRSGATTIDLRSFCLRLFLIFFYLFLCWWGGGELNFLQLTYNMVVYRNSAFMVAQIVMIPGVVWWFFYR